MQFNKLSQICYKYINEATIENVVNQLLGIVVVNEVVLNKKENPYVFDYKECYDWYVGNKNIYENIRNCTLNKNIKKNSLFEAKNFLNKNFTLNNKILFLKKLNEQVVIDKDITYNEFHKTTLFYLNKRYEEFLIEILYQSINTDNKKEGNSKIIQLEIKKQLELLLSKLDLSYFAINKETINLYNNYITKAVMLIYKEKDRKKVNKIFIDVYEIILEIINDNSLSYNTKLNKSFEYINKSTIIYDNESINKKILKGLVILAINNRLI